MLATRLAVLRIFALTAAAFAVCALTLPGNAVALAPPKRGAKVVSLPSLPRLVDVTTQTEERLGLGVSYFLIPHPDDELSAWALVSRAKFPVFVLLTQGEASSHCPKADLTPPACKQARVESWNKFLDDYFDRGIPISGEGYTGFVSSASARLVFDLGDRSLTVSSVTAALDEARQVGSQRGPEEYVVSSSIRYGHPDHEVVYRAVRDYTGLGRLAVSGTPRAFSNVTVRVTGLGVLVACPGGSIDNAYRWLSDSCWKVSNNIGDVYRIANPQLFVNLDPMAPAP